ncbi:MAG TPA: hypothetical protein VF486_03705 [Actinomycetes bacterium]
MAHENSSVAREPFPAGRSEGGLVVGDLDADAVLLTPAHQFPTGAVLSGRRRREPLELAVGLLAAALRRAGAAA